MFSRETYAGIGKSWWEWFEQRAHGRHAIFWLLLVSFLEPIVLPLVPESLMVAMILARRQDWKKYVTLTALASALGGTVGYGIGWFLFKEIGIPLLSVWGLHRWFHAVEGMLHGNVFIVMLLITFTPIPDKAFVILAGFFHVAFIPYVLGFLLGRFLRFGIVGYLVQRFGAQVLGVVREYFEWLALLVVLALLFAVLHFSHMLPF